MHTSERKTARKAKFNSPLLKNDIGEIREDLSELMIFFLFHCPDATDNKRERIYSNYLNLDHALRTLEGKEV